MKNLIILFFLSLPSLVMGQFQFQGTAKSLDSLNTAAGQNYLVLNPFANELAYTEEQNGGTDAIFRRRDIQVEKSLITAYIFTDDNSEKGMVSPIGFDEAGNLYYSVLKYEKGIYAGSVSIVAKDGSSAKEVNIPYFKNKAPMQSGTLSKDGQYLIISGETNNTNGVEDLYVSKKNKDGTWSSLKNLGNVVNSSLQEITPHLAIDNKTLFFASNGHGGAGSFDLFYATRLDDSWRNWSAPQNLGPLVNTSGAESSFSFRDGDSKAYFIRSLDSDGYGDIFSIDFLEEIEEDTTQVVEVAVVAESLESADQTIEVLDAKSKEPISASIISGRVILESTDGVFAVDSSFLGSVEVKAAGYLPVLISRETLSSGKNTVLLNSIAKGNTVKLEHILFKRGTDELIAGTYSDLDLVVEVMKENPDLKILIKGHTDNQGDPVRNIELSEDRVRTVKKYIVSQGISPYRVKGRGYGGNQPIASNAQEETRKLNRRVEFEVIED